MFSRLVSGIFGAIGAVTFVQFPAFFQQYLQRLGGHLDQSKADVQRFVEAGQQQGMKLTDYITNLAENSDSTVQETAKAIQGTVDDLEHNQSAYEALSGANVYEQPLAFARWLNPGISQETFGIFEPSLPLNLTGLVYAVIGIIVGIFVLTVVWKLIAGIGRLFNNRRSSSMMRDLAPKA